MTSLLAFFALALMAADEPQTIDLGGLRQVKAVIRRDRQNYAIDVHFLPVSCFDKVTNQEMNVSLGRSFALQALARHLSDKPSVELVVSGARTTAGVASGKLFAVSVQVPRDGVQVVDKPEGVTESPAEASGDAARDRSERASSDPSTLTRKGQYDAMIAELGKMLDKDLRRLRAETAPERPAAERVDAFQKKLDGAFDRLAQEIKSDLELTNLGSDLDPELKGDKDALLARVARARERLIQQLKEAAGR
jgi:hypothetical protein